MGRGERGGAASDSASIAVVVQRLGVLLAAGTAPASAWGHVAHAGTARVVREIAEACAAGVPVPDALLAAAESPRETAAAGARFGFRARTGADADAAAHGDAWRAVAAAWEVAERAGAPISSTLAALAESLRDLDQLERETAAALAAPAATARLVMVLPPIGVVFGAALGFDTVSVLFATAPGWACLAAGGALLFGARAWNRRLLRSARRSEVTPGLRLDLLAVAMSGGAAIDRGVEAVAGAMERCGLEVDDATAAEETLELSRRAGVPAAHLLRTEAQEQRRRARGEGAKRAATLGVTLMLPLALCVLPAFMLLGVAPLMMAVITSTIGV